MRKFQGWLFVLKQKYICNYIIYMTLPLIINLKLRHDEKTNKKWLIEEV